MSTSPRLWYAAFTCSVLPLPVVVAAVFVPCYRCCKPSAVSGPTIEQLTCLSTFHLNASRYNKFALFSFTTRCVFNAFVAQYVLRSSIRCLSVHHKLVFCWNGWMDQSRRILNCAAREFGYCQNQGYFRLEPCSKTLYLACHFSAFLPWHVNVASVKLLHVYHWMLTLVYNTLTMTLSIARFVCDSRVSTVQVLPLSHPGPLRFTTSQPEGRVGEFFIWSIKEHFSLTTPLNCPLSCSLSTHYITLH